VIGRGESPNYPPILATTRFVVENARLVTIDRERVAAVADDLAARKLNPTTYDCERHLCGTDPAVANFVLVLDTLNFSFWADPGESRWRVTDRGETANGYWALVAALRRALDEGVPLTEAGYLATITKDELGHVLRGEGSIPLLDERVAALREIGRGLLERDGGQFTRMIERASRSAPALARLLATEFSSFADETSFADQIVYFYKRAQICCSDLYGAARGREWGDLTDLDCLTAFADYKVPQVLRELGIITYVDELADLVDRRVRFPPGSNGEVEIRAATIWGVEYLRDALADRGVDLRAFEVDWHLWELGQTLPPDTRPYHLTRTIFY
jgi:hypothetical protein